MISVCVWLKVKYRLVAEESCISSHKGAPGAAQFVKKHDKKRKSTSGRWTLHRKPCNALQRTATHCNALQRTATHCIALQHRSLFLKSDSTPWEMRSKVYPTREGICFWLFLKHSLTDSFCWKEAGNTYTVGLQRNCREALPYISSLRRTDHSIVHEIYMHAKRKINHSSSTFVCCAVYTFYSPRGMMTDPKKEKKDYRTWWYIRFVNSEILHLRTRSHMVTLWHGWILEQSFQVENVFCSDTSSSGLCWRLR